MPSYSVKVTSDGTIPVPPQMAASLAIKPGEEVEFFVTADGHIHFHVLREDFGSVTGFRPAPPVSIREMDDAIADHLLEDNDRILASGRHVRKPAAE